MSEVVSLWPDFAEVAIELPKKILEDQALIFNNNLSGILECKITSREKPLDVWESVSIGSTKGSQESPQEVSMYIIAPKVGGYRLAILNVVFLISEVYPCKVENCLDPTSPPMNPKDPEEFKTAIKKVLNSERVVKAISVLRQQSL